MSGSDRIAELRILAARIARLPQSEERDRVLGEVRARLVDLDTGTTPRAMRAAEPPPVPRDLRARRDPGPPPPRRALAPVPVPASGAVDLLATAERLCLEEDVASGKAWRRGLRG